MPSDRVNIAALPSYLTWERGTDLLRNACTNNVRWSYLQLRTWSHESHTDLFDQVVALPKHNQQRLLLAPQAFHVLQSTSRPGEQDVAAFRRFIETEKFLHRQDEAYPEDSWSALGDYYLPPANLAVAGADEEWSIDRAYKAKPVGAMIVDACSPYATTGFPIEVGDVELHTSDEVEAIAQKVQESLGQILSVSEIARLTVDSCEQVMTVAKAPAAPHATMSISTRAMIGRLGMVNLHANQWNTCKISNQIVHEAIHSMIYKLELFDSLYTDQDAALNLKAVSPWSGRTLALHSFVHACFVWFGLWCFWNRSGSGEEKVLKLKEKACKGFLKGVPHSGISQEAFDCIMPDVRDVIREMHAYIIVRNSN